MVTGIEPPILDNVLSRLTIFLQKDNERLQKNAVRRLHAKAGEDIRQALAPFGYYNPLIDSSLAKLEAGWRAEYSIDKGVPLLVEAVDLQLTSAGRENHKLLDALSIFPLAAGKVLNQVDYETEKKKLVNLAIAEGYLDALFSLKRLQINPGDNSGTIALTLNTGPRYRFGKTTCLDNILRESHLERYLPYKEGDPYSSAKLFELQSILYKTDYFSKVVVSGKVDRIVGLDVPVEIELVSPDHLNKYSVGAGYGTDTGARGKVDWGNRFFNDRGHRISVSLQLAELEKTISLSYEVPREKNPRFDKVVHNLAYQDKTWEDTTTRLLTGAVSREYSGPRFKLGVGLEARAEVYDIGDTSGTSTLLLPSVNLGLVIADDILNTKHGLQASVGVKGAVEGAFSDATFLQATVNGKAIITPYETIRIIGRVSVGATLVDSIDSLPPSLRFYTGGDSTIRGYSYKSIGTTDSSGTVIGGRYLIVESIEVEKIFGKYWSLAAFWDGGTATDDLELDYYQGVGGGLRFRLPFGQIRLDVASAITEDGYPVRAHLTVGGDL